MARCLGALACGAARKVDILIRGTEEIKTISTTIGRMVITKDDDLTAKLREFQLRCVWPAAAVTA